MDYHPDNKPNLKRRCHCGAKIPPKQAPLPTCSAACSRAKKLGLTRWELLESEAKELPWGKPNDWD